MRMVQNPLETVFAHAVWTISAGVRLREDAPGPDAPSESVGEKKEAGAVDNRRLRPGAVPRLSASIIDFSYLEGPNRPVVGRIVDEVAVIVFSDIPENMVSG